MNTFESNCIRKIAQDIGMKKYIIVNSCAITAESERQVRQKIRQLYKENPGYRVIITGCSSQIHRDYFFEMKEIDFVISNNLKCKKSAYEKIHEYFQTNYQYDIDNSLKRLLQSELFEEDGQTIHKNDINQFDSYEYLYDFENRSRAFVPIQNGCNHFCAFCIVPFTRGTFVSYNPDKIIKQIQIFVDNGYNEVVLTGIDITDYGKDIRGKENIDTLGKLCKAILKNTGVKRLRLSSVDVAEIDNDIIDLVSSEPRFMPYFHISLQSGSNSVLKRMRRRHTFEDVINFCEKILKVRPDSAFGADIITGFPGETDEEFQKSVDIVKQAPITFVHAFPYSRREKTLAYLMNDNVSKRIKKERVKTLIKLGEENLQKIYIKMSGKIQKCIVEQKFIARCENFVQIHLNKEMMNNLSTGSIIEIKPLLKDGKLFYK